MNRTLGLSVLSLAIFLGATGCSSYSEDRDVFKSTYLKPKTVSYIYKPSNQTAWTYDIPPQTILVVERDAGDGNLEFMHLDQGNPRKLMWELYPIDATQALRMGHYLGKPLDSGEMALNNSPGIIAWALRDPIDPATQPQDRPIEEIEKDLPEPDDNDGLPEPDAAEEAE